MNDPEDELEAEGLMPSLRAFRDWRVFGRLPFDGGLYDQDPLILRDFRLIEQTIARREARERQREKAKNGG